MSSYLEKQRESFTGGLAAAASKLGGGSSKKPLAPPSPSPSITSTTSAPAANATPTKRKDDGALPAGAIYSQPANTGVGESLFTQMTYVVEWLKGKDEPKPLSDVLGHLSAQHRPDDAQSQLADLLRSHPRIQWIPDPALSEQTWRTGTYAHRPTIPNVRTKTQLLAYLQRKVDAQGVSVKDLKDGWPEVERAIDELEREHRILVVRTKKDNHARAVWIDDPSLVHTVDNEFRSMWHKVEVPTLENIVQRLTAVGQVPTSDDPRKKALLAAPKVEKKKRKTARKPGKLTNSHMEHLLKDYSHLKR